MKKKTLVILLLAAACLCFLAGVYFGYTDQEKSQTGSQGFTPKLDKETAQNILVIGNYSNFEAMDAAAAAFREYYPNVTIEYEKLDDYNNNLAPRLAGDSNVGLFMVNGYNFLYNDGLEDSVADVSKLDLQWDEIDPDAYTGNTVNGKTFGIALWYRYYGMVMNTTLMAKEGLTTPKNWSEMENCLKQLKESGYVPIQQHPDGMWGLFYGDMAHIAKGCTDEQIESLKKGDKGSAEVMRTLFDRVFEMLEKGYISVESMAEYEDYYNAAILKFYEGNAPILAASTSTVSGMEKRESRSESFQANPFEYSFTFAPLADEGAYVYKGHETCLGLNSGCEYFDMAAEFYRFIYTEKELNEMSRVKGAPSTAKNPDNELYSALGEASIAETILPSDYDDPTGVIQNAFGKAVKAIFSGEAENTDEAIAMMEVYAMESNQTE